jgi:hypothetical protein
MAAPRIPGQFLKTGYQSGTKRVEMNVADQFLEIGIFLADDRLVSVLEQVAGSVMAEVEIDSMSSQKTAHKAREFHPVAA